ncbi:anthranilate synthase component I family protein [Pontibacter harenae]|uniref:anthranilate synthase component I family protein n=1 Tax=Pontibacter harenae TaxID=2894083 RepID=UPI001E2AA1D6|nr:anthranilate synthase component I family protein [Pontibacter harenae]MCC9168320.1 anthranilate synthase component I family protein [Pontibacter harenae]
MFTHTISVADLPISLEEFRQKALAWADKQELVAYYTSNEIPYLYNGFEHLLAVSSTTGAAIQLDEADAFASLRQQLAKQSGLWCGFLSYDLKNQVEKLHSDNHDGLQFPLLFFFQPEVYIYFKEDKLILYSSERNIETIIATILATAAPAPLLPLQLKVQQRVAQDEYINQVNKIKQHILEGDVYELNYCIEFFAEDVQLQPLPLYLALNAASPTPFSGYLKLQDKYLLCASPERYLKKDGQKLISQPIKGTIKRGATPAEDQELQQQLRHDEKELAENMMIVDLVRNDLSRSCSVGTVQVEEMFGIYGFQQVSQMISTVTGELHPEKNLVDALKESFPMGSMTGAPKISAMQLIEELETTKRGLYSGAFGYVTADQNFDFNVVIRSIQYNASNGYLSFMVGSAITYDSTPEQEYQECFLKAKAILKVLGQG